MSPARRTAAWLASAWLLGGCAVDLWVGEPTSTTGDGTASTDEGTSSDPLATDAGTSTTGSEPHATTDGETTVAPDDGTSSTGSIVEEGTSTGPVEEGTATTDAEMPCRGLGMEACNELEACLWYGTPKTGECAPSPCESLEHECFRLPLGDCEAAFACAWVGEGELGECAPIECAPCELLGLEQCSETPTCVWDEGEMFCFPA